MTKGLLLASSALLVGLSTTAAFAQQANDVGASSPGSSPSPQNPAAAPASQEIVVSGVRASLASAIGRKLRIEKLDGVPFPDSFSGEITS